MTAITSTVGAASPAATGARTVDLSDIGDPTKMPDHDVSFSDVLSVLNPLQYIPVVGTIYRAVTGDTIPPAAQVLGSALLGGPLGLVASAADAIWQQASGKDLGEHVVALFTPDSHTSTPPPQYAAATPPAASTTLATASATDTKSAPTSPASPAAAAIQTTAVEPSGATTSPSTAAAQPASPPPAATGATPPAGTAAAGAITAASAATALPVSGGTSATAKSGATAGKATGTGWTLADYRMFSGHGMPPSTGSNGMEFHSNPVPLQTSMPLPGEVSPTSVVPTAAQPTATAAAPAAPANAPQPAPQQPQGSWISQAMMHGLDRYRQMMIQQEQPQAQPQPTMPPVAPAVAPPASSKSDTKSDTAH